MKKLFETAFTDRSSALAQTAAENFCRTIETNPLMEFHICRSIREKCSFDEPLFASSGNVVLTNFKQVRVFAKKINDLFDPLLEGSRMIKAGQLNAVSLIDEIFHYVCFLFRKQENPKAFEELYTALEKKLGEEKLTGLLLAFVEEFPPLPVYKGKMSAEEYLDGRSSAADILSGNAKKGNASDSKAVLNKVSVLEELCLLHLANENPAFDPFSMLFSNEHLEKNASYAKAWTEIKAFFVKQPLFGPNKTDLVSMLKEPVIASPNSLKGQLDYIRQHWGSLLGEWLLRLLSGIDLIQEEEKPGWSGNFSGPPPMEAYNYDYLMNEYERFSSDREWMPRVVLMAKTVLVWLDQLTKKYKKDITTLDQIPDAELDALSRQGFTGLWLIGLWERSWGSKRIKQINGNSEAAASAYSLHDYDIAQGLGGWEALDNLRKRLWYRGIRLASDMVPNHTGLDSKWVVEKPDLFLQSRDCPFPSYSFNGQNLSLDPRISVYLEDNYYNKTDCAVVYKRVDNSSGQARYIYHGNDGTGLPWNDTAQIDFLNPEAREEVIQKILLVARNFPIIRFDAAMVLAKKHIKRLWYPEPGQGGDIASRAEHALSNEEFEKRIPNEFWREVVDRCAAEVPDTLLLAEAFWMMEGYFVRTLGMHRVYNSAFMNMLKKEENSKYRSTVKNTLEFDPQVLKRFVNFMNNPDEETAVAQFGKEDKYFGVCTLMVTMPGLPMFGHGQIEGFTEKYGMEFTKAYWDETPDQILIDRHDRDIFPLMKKRYLFAEIENFRFYDVWNNGSVNENIFAYSNRFKDERAVVFYNNVYAQASGWIKDSCRFAVKNSDGESRFETQTIAQAVGLTNEANAYCIFQEHRTGLWFIRSSKEIYENGLFVHLNGFEYQVLVNISEVKDDETGKWALLCSHLSGRGVMDIDIALKEVFLKELYSALKLFATKEFFDQIAVVFTPAVRKKTEKIKDVPLSTILTKSKKAGIHYFETLLRFIEGNYGFSSILDKKQTGLSAGSEIVWNRFKKRLTNLVKFAEIAQGKGLPSGKTSENTSSLSNFLYEGMLAHPFMSEILTAYTLLYSVRDVIGEKATARDSKELINLWCLDRKIRDLLVEYGRPSKDMYEVFKTLLEVTKFCDYPILVKDLQMSAYLVSEAVVRSPESSIILGANIYDNVLWINKERTEFAVWAAALVYAVFTAKPNEHLHILSVFSIVMKALSSSGYDAERFLSALRPLDEKQIQKALVKLGLLEAPAKKSKEVVKPVKKTVKKPKTAAGK